ncbi:hypothetical protein ALP62_05511 [Pseudomonas syringae pv. aceris]|nr:hypothetical protein ALP62_05511 [Pseudomonas syringae pv. aceris]
MAALDLGEVQRAQIAADQRAAGEDHFRQGVQATLGNRAGAVADALAAFQVLLDDRVVLVALELVERRQVRVAIGQVDDQADHYLIVLQVVQERAARIGIVQRPACGVHHQPLFMFGRVDFPDFLEADSVMLHVGFVVEVEALEQLLADVTTAAFGEQRVLGAQFHAGGVQAFLRIAFAVDTQIPGDDAAHYTVFVEQRFLSGKARIDFDTEVFSLLSQPAAQVAQRDDVVAMVVHGLGDEKVRYFLSFFSIAQHIDVVALDRRVERSAQFLPVGEQFIQRAGLEYRTGEDVRADFGAFFHHADADFLASFSGLLFKAASGRKPGRAGSDDNDVEFHVFAFHRLSPTLKAHGVFMGTAFLVAAGRRMEVLNRPVF